MTDDLHEDADLANTQQAVVTPTTRFDGTATSALFGLPTELRIIIYEFTLLQNGIMISVDAHWRVPAFLQVSWRTRDEASSVYYKGNGFVHHITDCNADLMQRWVGRYCNLGLNDIKNDMSFGGEPDWKNLMRWCQGLCDGEAGMSVDGGDETDEMESVIETANDIAMQFRHADRTWEECKPVLMALRRTVGKFEPQWLE
ncbi:hypothetical protein LTR97_001088 [Elasticomyces elasticus]|uniref:Uncharacterized protein n=1 Tax=Elasticomyces elasticus TaxID=574655 RepID=A0AAN7WQ52_9PEZI|nr:hypothetical protein LTR97_001088 [Elasticomyces elasticus]